CVGISVRLLHEDATTEVSTLSLHDALPILEHRVRRQALVADEKDRRAGHPRRRADEHRFEEARQIDRFAAQPLAHQLPALLPGEDRKSTRLNSSHSQISYAVFCLKKKNTV